MTRTLRRLSAWLAFTAFAFAQMAISVYACPMATPQAAASEDPCAGFATPNLCEQHCEYGSTSVATHADAFPAPDFALLGRDVVPASDFVPSSVVPANDIAHLAAPPPPGRPIPLRI